MKLKPFLALFILPLCVGQALLALAQDNPPVPRLLTLPECLAQGLAAHPMIAAAEARLLGANEMRRYAGEKPNPSVTLQSENWRFPGNPAFVPGRDLDLFIYGTQTIERGGKARRRTELADRGIELATDESRAVRWRLQQEITRGFYRALQAQTAFESARDNRALLATLIEYANQRVSAGFAAESELVRAKLEQQTLETVEASAALEWERARLELLRALGDTKFDTNFRLVGAENLPPALPVTELERIALNERPDLTALRSKLAAAQANLRVAKADLTPDVDLSLGYKRTGGLNTMLATITIPLTLHKRQLGHIGQLSAEISAMEYEIKSVEQYIKAELTSLHQSSQRLNNQLAMMKQDYLRNAQDAYDIALIAYREGVHDLYKLLDAQRARNEAQLLNLKTRIDLQAALTELTLATGKELK